MQTPESQSALQSELEAGTTELYADPLYFEQLYKNHYGDRDWYIARYLKTQGPILELGVGAGRIALPAVAGGAVVTGIDLSRAMLDYAKKRAESLPESRKANLSLIEGDIRNPPISNQFSLIACPFNTLQHLYYRQDVDACLSAVKRLLRKDGRFIFDVLKPDLEMLAFPFCREGFTFTHPTHGVRYSYMSQGRYDRIDQIWRRCFTFKRCDGEPEKGPATFVQHLTQRIFFPAELDAILYANGFEIKEQFGDFEGNEPSEKSRSMILECAVR